jgi:diguanylate cyclase (GGDEF)-like protein
MVEPKYAMLLRLAAVALAMDRFNGAFSIASSSNVIVTSREFTFKTLSANVILLSKKGHILDWNKKGPGAFDPLPTPRFKEAFRSYRARIAENGGKFSKHDENVFTLRHDGDERHYQIVEHEVNEKGRVHGAQVEISDVTHIFAVLRQFEDIAFQDTMTGLNNKNSYLTEAQNIISRQTAPFALILGDANGLKFLNDTYGHKFGDRLLIVIAEIIKECLPEGGLAFRIGGDEYVVLLPGYTAKAAQEFISAFKYKAERLNDPEVGNPSMSLGYAVSEVPVADDKHSCNQ